MIEASTTSKCIPGAHLSDQSIHRKQINCAHTILMAFYHMRNILSSYWGCGKFFIIMYIHVYMYVHILTNIMITVQYTCTCIYAGSPHMYALSGLNEVTRT